MKSSSLYPIHQTIMQRFWNWALCFCIHRYTKTLQSTQETLYWIGDNQGFTFDLEVSSKYYLSEIYKLHMFADNGDQVGFDQQLDQLLIEGYDRLHPSILQAQSALRLKKFVNKINDTKSITF